MVFLKYHKRIKSKIMKGKTLHLCTQMELQYINFHYYSIVDR